MQPFTRQLGSQPGVQVNPIIDKSEGRLVGNEGQYFATAIRLQRGDISRAFLVTKDNFARVLGPVASIRANPLNEGIVQVYEALRAGALGAVVSRLSPSTAVLNRIEVLDEALAGDVYNVVTGSPTAGYLFTIKHHECFNEGITVKVNALTAYDTDGVTLIPSKMIKLGLYDINGQPLFNEITASLDPNAVDDFGETLFLTDIAAAASNDLIEIVVNTGAEVSLTAAFYGKDGSGNDKVVEQHLVYFDENSTSYTNSDYDKSISQLQYTEYRFGYLTTCGSQSKTLISKFLGLAFTINKTCAWDVHGSLSPTAAMAWVADIGAATDSLYSHCYWTPLTANDPLNGGRAFIGTSGLQIGYRCARNAITDANGVPARNRVIAGKEYQVTRTGIKQVVTPKESELSQLADARINPVLAVHYNSGSRYVFSDSLTGAKTQADRKLIAVADMATQIDDWVAAQAQEYLQLPMTDAVQLTTDYLQLLFEALQTAGWLVPSAKLDNRAFIGQVAPNNMRPNDRMDVSYSLSYVGTTRQIYQQQTIAPK